MVSLRSLLFLSCLGFLSLIVNAWMPPLTSQRCTVPSDTLMMRNFLVLNAAGDGKKKKRRRKQPPPGTVALPSDSIVSSDSSTIADYAEPVDDEDDDVGDDADLSTIADVANYKFKVADDNIVEGTDKRISEGEAIPLPDIRDTLKRKEIEEEMARLNQEKEKQKAKIKRSDRQAFVKLLEQQPYADADDSLFEEEKYGTVSALLGEGAKSFLGIPFGPLQVGHFIGALGIVLMAFVEYPGFPLTNLPTPLRDSLQGGLASVYTINLVLAVATVFKAGEKGQPPLLWATKTLVVGGLAFDQLMQLPSFSEVESNAKRSGKAGQRKK